MASSLVARGDCTALSLGIDRSDASLGLGRSSAGAAVVGNSTAFGGGPPTNLYRACEDPWQRFVLLSHAPHLVSVFLGLFHSDQLSQETGELV